MFDLTSLSKRHLRGSGSRLLSFILRNHTLNVPVAYRTVTSKTFGSVYGSSVEYPSLNLPENECNIERYARIPGFYERGSTVTPFLPEREAFSLCTV